MITILKNEAPPAGKAEGADYFNNSFAKGELRYAQYILPRP